MSTTDTKVDELIINTLTKAQYDDLVANNQVEANQLYLTKDEDYYMQIDVTYGTTTYAQITSALGAKQEPVCNYNSYQYTYAGNDGTYYYFTCAINNEIKYIRVNSASTWSNGTASLQTTISDLGTIRANASLGASAVQPGDLATVATTGSYTDLTATPSLSTVATSGSYTDLTNKPTIPTVNNSTVSIQKNSTTVGSFTLNQSGNSTINITVPTKVSDLNNDSGFITGITANNVTVALGYTPYNSTNPSGYTSNTGTVKSVQVQAGTGLSSSTSTAQNTTLSTTISIASGYKLPTTTEWGNKQDALPSQSGNSGKFLTTNGSTMSWGSINTTVNNATVTIQKNSTNVGSFTLNQSSNATINISVPTTVAELSDSSNYIDNSELWELATVATSGSYNDLSNKPTIPTVSNSTITIQKNGTNVSSFTLNQSGNATVNITVPTQTSELTNNSGFITGITANNVTTALGYTPYNSSNPSGYTSNTGTVKSVQVQAGTGLSSSTSTAQNTTLSTTISVASGYKLPTTTEWGDKQDTISDLSKIRSGANSFYVKGTQTASTNAFTGTLSAISELYEGLTIDYWLPFKGTDSGATLNLTLAGGTTTGAVNCYYSGTTRLTTHLSANCVGRFIYQTVTISGTNYTGWWLLKAYFSDSNTYDRTYDNYYRAYAGAAIPNYALLMKGANGRLYPMVTSYGTATTKVVTTTGLRPDCIWWYNGNETRTAGQVIKAQSLYRVAPSTAGNSFFNEALPTYCDIYLCGNYDKDTGLFYLATTNASGTASTTDFYRFVPYNSEPNYSDYFIEGRYYIFLGSSYSTANYFQLMNQHPLFYFDGTNLIPVTARAEEAVGVNDVRTDNTIKTWTGTKEQYDAIITKDANTLYNVTDDNDTTLTLLETIYPIGSIYIGTMGVCPLATLGIGSWEKVSEGKVLQGSDTNHSAGTTIAAGLPNITGQHYEVTSKDGEVLYTGAFYKSGTSTNTYRAHNSDSGNYPIINFDASRSSSIYGNSNTVQPPAFVVNIWRRIS